MYKIFISSFIIVGGGIFGTSIASATNDSEVMYNLKNHSPIETYQLLDTDSDELIEITIIDNSFVSRMADKTYTISKNKKNSWSISYKISVKNNKITSAYGGNFTATQGNFSNTSVSKHSDTLAIGKGSWKYRAAVSSIQAKATISNKNLIIE